MPEASFNEEEVDNDDEVEEEVTNSFPTWLSAQMESGKEIYMKATPGGGFCFTCHQPNGEGLNLGQPGAIPPLAGSDWVLGRKEKLIKIAIHGLQGEIKVNGDKYNGAMTGFGQMGNAPLNNQQIADVLTYIRNDWGNSASAVSPEEVKTVRNNFENRNLMQMWTATELENNSSSD